MMKFFKKQASADIVTALLLFAVFATGVLFVLFSGAEIYKKVTERDQQAYTVRTCSQYIMTRLRQAESTDEVSVTSFGDSDALQIVQNVEENKFVTRIYCYDGWLMELYTTEKGSINPQDGQQIFPLENLEVVKKEKMLQILLTMQNGEKTDLRYSLRRENIS